MRCVAQFLVRAPCSTQLERSGRVEWNPAAMSAWDTAATSPFGSSSGTPTVVNVSLQAGAAFHLHQAGGARPHG
eukprot:15213942-Alexandrium_andersonii.AAC.1